MYINSFLHNVFNNFAFSLDGEVTTKSSSHQYFSVENYVNKMINDDKKKLFM